MNQTFHVIQRLLPVPLFYRSLLGDIIVTIIGTILLGSKMTTPVKMLLIVTLAMLVTIIYLSVFVYLSISLQVHSQRSPCIFTPPGATTCLYSLEPDLQSTQINVNQQQQQAIQQLQKEEQQTQGKPDSPRTPLVSIPSLFPHNQPINHRYITSN